MVDKFVFMNYSVHRYKKQLHQTRKGSDFMGKAKNEHLTSEQITDARRLCEVIKGVPGRQRPIFEIVMLAYMNGMEAGAAYVKDATQTATAR